MQEREYVRPETIAGANQDGPHTSSITLLVQDDNSGVGATYYWIDAAAQSTLYTRPFDAPIGSTVTFQPLLRFLDPQGDEDWFTFHATGRSTYSVGLLSLPADYDLEPRGRGIACTRTCCRSRSSASRQDTRTATRG